MPITPKGIIVHSMSEYLKLDDGPMYAHDFLKSIGLSVHGFVKPDGTYEIVIHAIGFKSTQHAQDFMNDITNFEWQQENPTIH